MSKIEERLSFRVWIDEQKYIKLSLTVPQLVEIILCHSEAQRPIIRVEGLSIELFLSRPTLEMLETLADKDAVGCINTLLAGQRATMQPPSLVPPSPLRPLRCRRTIAGLPGETTHQWCHPAQYQPA
jgi:hypothetical protein